MSRAGARCWELVDSEKAAFPVAVLCEAVGVSRSAYYAWRRAARSAREPANERVLAEIRAIIPDEIAAGHCVALSQPRELAELLVRYAAGRREQ